MSELAVFSANGEQMIDGWCGISLSPNSFIPARWLKGGNRVRGGYTERPNGLPSNTTATGVSVQPPIKKSLPVCISAGLSNDWFINCLLKPVCHSRIYCSPKRTVRGHSCSSSGLTIYLTFGFIWLMCYDTKDVLVWVSKNTHYKQKRCIWILTVTFSLIYSRICSLFGPRRSWISDLQTLTLVHLWRFRKRVAPCDGRGREISTDRVPLQWGRHLASKWVWYDPEVVTEIRKRGPKFRLFSSIVWWCVPVILQTSNIYGLRRKGWQKKTKCEWTY